MSDLYSSSISSTPVNKTSSTSRFIGMHTNKQKSHVDELQNSSNETYSIYNTERDVGTLSKSLLMRLYRPVSVIRDADHDTDYANKRSSTSTHSSIDNKRSSIFMHNPVVETGHVSIKELSIRLYIACSNSDVDAIKSLVKKGADVNYKNMDDNGWTPLHRACKYRHYDVAKSLISYGANVYIKDEYGETPLHTVCLSGHYKMAVLLISNSHIYNSKSVKTNETNPIGIAKIHSVYVNEKNIYGITPLHRLCYYGCSKTARLLISYGANVNCKDNGNDTPLHCACYNGCYETVRLLLTHEANTNEKNNSGFTPIHIACCNGHSNVVELLIAYYSVPNK